MSVFYVPAEPRPLCLVLSDDRTLPLQCRFRLDHSGDHDWQIERSGVTEYRAQLLRDEQDSPSGMLPRRTPGVALGDVEASDGVEGPEDAAGGARSILGRSVIERWRG